MPGQPDSSGDGLPGAAAQAPLPGWVVTGFQSGGKRMFWKVCWGHGRRSRPWSTHLLLPTRPDSSLTQDLEMCTVYPRKGMGATGRGCAGVTQGPVTLGCGLAPEHVAGWSSQMSTLETCVVLQGPWRSPGHRKKGLFLEAKP